MPSTLPDARPLILLVDDDEDSRYLYSEYLTSAASYRLAEASDGRQAIELAAELMPDVIVMDLTLPILDGREAMRALRLDARTRAIPIVALTGHADVKASNEPGVGFQAVLLKPCLPGTLAHAIESLLPPRLREEKR